jgi:uncharacterized protein YydD (DUF2326 family)
MNEKRLFQIQKVEADLKELKNGQQAQASILGEMKDVLKEIGATIKNLSKINEKQIRHDTEIEGLKEDSKKFKKFMENSRCSEHSTELKVLTKASDSKNNFAAMLISGFLLVLVTGLLTWMITKG